jgi:hypothetical protein
MGTLPGTLPGSTGYIIRYRYWHYILQLGRLLVACGFYEIGGGDYGVNPIGCTDQTTMHLVSWECFSGMHCVHDIDQC